MTEVLSTPVFCASWKLTDPTAQGLDITQWLCKCCAALHCCFVGRM